MVKKMGQKKRPRIFAACAFVAMGLINIFALCISTITLMLLAAAVSLILFKVKGGDGK